MFLAGDLQLRGVGPRADAWGTAGLLACLAAGSFYQQPPMRAARGGRDAKDGAESEPTLDLSKKTPLLSNKSPV